MTGPARSCGKHASCSTALLSGGRLHQVMSNISQAGYCVQVCLLWQRMTQHWHTCVTNSNPAQYVSPSSYPRDAFMSKSSPCHALLPISGADLGISMSLPAWSCQTLCIWHEWLPESSCKRNVRLACAGSSQVHFNPHWLPSCQWVSCHQHWQALQGAQADGCIYFWQCQVEHLLSSKLCAGLLELTCA